MHRTLTGTDDAVIYMLLSDHEYGNDLSITVKRHAELSPGFPSHRITIDMYEYSWQHGSRQLRREVQWFARNNDERMIIMARLVEQFAHLKWIPEEPNATP